MADWYVSSAAYTSVPVFAGTTAYTVGQFARPASPASAREYSFRCTTAGTTAASEPTWPVANNATVTSGTATFTNVSGQSAYGWSAPAGTLACIVAAVSNRAAVGDRIFLSSDHSETTATATYAFGAGAAFGLIQLISVNRGGSVPPVAADVTSGAAVATSSAAMNLDVLTNLYWQGITLSGASGTGNGTISFGSSSTKNHYFKNCAFRLLSTNTASRFNFQSPASVTFDNCTVQFGNGSQAIASSANGSVNLTWLNTASAIQGATLPTTLFLSGSTATTVIATCRGVDLSAVTSNLANDPSGTGAVRVLLDSCRIASGVARLGSTFNNATNEVELVNCYDGTNVLNERHTPAGAVTTDRTTYLSGGAQDDIGAYALKLVSSSRSDKATLTLDSFALDVGLATVGASMTAMVEIVGSGLNNDDISLLLEYMGTSGLPIASFASSLPATVLTTASALASSTATWNSPPGTPVYQKLSVPFTPQRAGRLRGLVKLGKPSTTVWIDPVVRIT